jgi:large subunit ribosomal protein L35
MPKQKSHKGLLKRIRITKSKLVKFHHAGGRHLKSVKAGSRVRQYRQPTFALSADMRRLRAMLNLRVRPYDKPHAADEASASGKDV